MKKYKDGYYGITYKPKSRYDCARGYHHLDEVWDGVEHTLVCDECQLLIYIDRIDESSMQEKDKKREE